MRLCTLTISGTLAPPPSRVYYELILQVCRRYSGQDTFFETIFLLGLGDVLTAVDELDKQYFADNDNVYVLIGHSQGGLIASLLAIRHPDRVKAVVALATPFKGTTWTDPINMPLRGVVEAVNLLTRGKIRLRPTLRRFVVPIIPIVRDLMAHSEVCETITDYLEDQIGGHHTHALIGSNDMLVFPHRSANPVGPFVTNYIVAPEKEYQRLLPQLPEDLCHIDGHAGHLSIALLPKALAVIDSVVAEASQSIPA